MESINQLIKNLQEYKDGIRWKVMMEEPLLEDISKLNQKLENDDFCPTFDDVDIDNAEDELEFLKYKIEQRSYHSSLVLDEFKYNNGELIIVLTFWHGNTFTYEYEFVNGKIKYRLISLDYFSINGMSSSGHDYYNEIQNFEEVINSVFSKAS